MKIYILLFNVRNYKIKKTITRVDSTGDVRNTLEYFLFFRFDLESCKYYNYKTN